MHCHMSCLVDNTGESNLFKNIMSTTSLHEIYLYKLILSSSHKFLCSMEDNPLLVDMCIVLMLIVEVDEIQLHNVSRSPASK